MTKIDEKWSETLKYTSTEWMVNRKQKIKKIRKSLKLTNFRKAISYTIYHCLWPSWLDFYLVQFKRKQTCCNFTVQSIDIWKTHLSWLMFEETHKSHFVDWKCVNHKRKTGQTKDEEKNTTTRPTTNFQDLWTRWTHFHSWNSWRNAKRLKGLSFYYKYH